MLCLIMLRLVICGQVSSLNVFRPTIYNSNRSYSGFISNSGTSNHGINSGNDNFENHNEYIVVRNNRDIVHFGHVFGINYLDSNHVTENFGNHHADNHYSNDYEIGNFGTHHGNSYHGSNFRNGKVKTT